MAWITPKTDWTSNGFYNFADLNRVENNVNEIVTLINTLSSMSPLTVITNRDMTAIEFFDSMNRIESNILALKNASYQPVDWITPKTDWVSVNEAFDYNDANRLETNLQALYMLLNSIIAYFKYAGQFYAGQDQTYL